MHDTPCFHCGQLVAAADLDPVRYPVIYRSVVQPTCCAGCQAVAETILAAGLERYYTEREAPADRAQPLPDALREQLRAFDLPAVQQSFVHQEAGSVREAALMLEGITCAACIWLNERHLMRLPGVIEASIHYTSHRARVRWDNDRIQLSEILAAIAAIGYRAHPYDPARSEAIHQKEQKQARARLWIAGLSMMQVMMFVVPVYLAQPGEIGPEWLRLMDWASCALTLPVVLYACIPFYQGAWRDLKRGRVGMDVPVVIGVLTAFLASVYANVTGHGAVYYDSVSMFVFLLLGGRYLEGAARRRAGEAVESLIKLMPAYAQRLGEDDQPTLVAVAELQPGDRVLVRPGDTYPADGEVLSGQGHSDESLLTGESRPIAKRPGDRVTGGAVNLDAPLTVRLTQVGESTQLAAIVRLLDKALAQKPDFARLADRISGGFVLALLCVAVATFAFWWQRDPEHALPITVAVLVISCPCALSLATPAALTAAMGRMAREGILVTRGQALEVLPTVTDVVFDKTGTLTTGQPALLDVLALAATREAALAIAAGIEGASEHPLARAIRAGVTPAAASDFENHPGEGVSAVVDGVRHWLGRPDFVARHCRASVPPAVGHWQSGQTVVWLVREDAWLAGLALGDAIRPEVATVLAALPAGLTLHVLSGDAAGPVQEIARALGIAHTRAGARPADKLAYVQALQAQGRRVLMVGDGINDAPVLAAADVSVAVGGATEAAQAAGDLVLWRGLEGLPAGMNTARKARRIIRQNLAWALGYNLIALPVAIAGWVTPWLASLGMAASSLLVVLNAIRLAPQGGRAVKQ